MYDGSVGQIENILGVLPSETEIGINRWIELFSIKTRIPNYYGPEQARVDNHAVCLMPFAQLDLLGVLSDISHCDKKNGRLFKALLKNNSPNLAHFKLVKGNIIHPFYLSSHLIRFYSRTKSKLGSVYVDKKRSEMFSMLKDYILDLINSQEVMNFELYDNKKLDRIAESFLHEKRRTLDLEWWLSFELFRQVTVKN